MMPVRMLKRRDLHLKKNSIYIRCVPLILIFILGTVVVSFFAKKNAKEQVKKLLIEQTAHSVSELQENLLVPISMVEAMGLIFKDGFFSDIKRTEQIFQGLSQKYPDFEVAFYGADEENHVFGFTPNEGYFAPGRPWYQGAVGAGGKICYSDVYLDPTIHANVITFSQGVYKNGKVDGAVAFDYPLSDLAKIINQYRVKDTYLSFIIAPDGKFVINDTYTPDDSIFTIEEGRLKEFGEQLIASGNEEGVLLTQNVDGVKYVFKSTKVPITGWYYIIGIPERDVMSFSTMLTMMLSAAFTVIFIMIVLVFVMPIIRMQKKEQEMSARLFEETQNLAVATKETSASSQDSNAAVKEIVATMEDSNALSENISQKIKNVSNIANNNSSEVQAGVVSIEKNVEQLHAIFDANQQSISGMKLLSEKIESIWEIVTLINSIADQAKIIAFNTELEVASAGAAGEPFRIVANEIRRLSDGIIDGTKEIKEKISDIQKSSDSLILTSQSSTEKINEGYRNAKELGEKFSRIKSSSEITADSAEDITGIIQQQAIGSEQILIALKQISGGIENFSTATENISRSAENLKGISEELNNQVNGGSAS